VTSTAAFLGFAVVAGLLTVTPGLDTALVLRASLAGGTRAAYATATGICSGLLVWGIAAAVGLSALVTASRVAYDVVRVVGAVYMVVLGLLMLGKARAGAHAAAPLADRAWRGYRRGVLTNLLNPKVGAFYVAVLPQFLPHGTSALLMGSALAMLHVLMSAAWFSILIVSSRRIRRLLARPRAQRAVDGATATVLVAFGLRLGLTS
jgi:threonine/homoserine/homoserine lactone efflux protein